MHFEVTLPEGINSWALKVAGFEAEEIDQLCAHSAVKKVKLPATVQCRYGNANAALTFFSFGERERIDRWLDKKGRLVIKRGRKPETGTHIRVDISDARAGRAAREKLERYCLDNDGEGKFWSEHCALYEAINDILGRGRVSVEKLCNGKGVLPRPTVVALMKLCERVERWQRGDIHALFTSTSVAKTDRDVVAGWLMKRFQEDPTGDDQLGVCVWENAVPSISEKLIRVIQDRRFDQHRAPLLWALAKTKHPRAAAVIVSIIDQPGMAFPCLFALGKTVGAQNHRSKIEKFLSHPDSDVRREAKKLIRKFDKSIQKPPSPIHLVKGRRSIPKELKEWSANIDQDELEPTLRHVCKCVEQGFGKVEIAEVLAVANQMEVEETTTFRFEVTANGDESELWLRLFMDDIDAPDLEIHASGKIIQKVRKSFLKTMAD